MSISISVAMSISISVAMSMSISVAMSISISVAMSVWYPSNAGTTTTPGQRVPHQFPCRTHPSGVVGGVGPSEPLERGEEGRSGRRREVQEGQAVREEGGRSREEVIQRVEPTQNQSRVVSKPS
eukprot:762501-Hanusia_phi.AAC.2